MNGECSFYADTVRHLANGKISTAVAAALTDHHTFKSLKTFTLAFFYFYRNDNSVTWCKRR